MLVSFAGILTAAAHQIMVGDTMPQNSHATLMNAILDLCFPAICAKVIDFGRRSSR